MLNELVDLIAGLYGLRYQVSPEQIVSYINMIQKIAYTGNVEAHVKYEAFTVYQKLTFAAGGYTDCVDADVGKPVVGAVSGALGTLISFDNDAEEWVVDVDSTLAAGGSLDASEVVSLTGGTGAGTLAATDQQTVYLGPYDYPDNARKIIGVTQYTDAELARSLFDDRSPNDPSRSNFDYGIRISDVDRRRMFEERRLDIPARTFTFIFAPDTEKDYRWVYYRRAPTIETADDDDNLLIPEEYHHTLIVEGVQALAANALQGELAPEQVLKPFLVPYWQNQEEPYDGHNQTSTGQPTG